MKQVRVVLGAVVAALVVVAATGCGGGSDSSNASAASGGDCTPGDSPVITLAAYSNPYDAYGKLTSTFAADWKESHSDQQVIFQMSFGGSTTQAENIVNGFPADVYAGLRDRLAELIAFTEEEGRRLQEKVLHAGGLEPGQIGRASCRERVLYTV